jgi:hypothetical protein
MKQQIVFFVALMGIVIAGVAQAKDRKDVPEFMKTQPDTYWAERHGYSTNAPVRVETDPEAKHFAQKRLESRVGRLEDRADAQESRLDRVESRVDRVESRLYWGYYPGYPVCKFARINSNAQLMFGTYYSSSYSHGTLYAGYTTVEIMSPHLSRWQNYPSDHALYVRVSSSYDGVLTGTYGYIDLQTISALSCGFGVSH